jgi:hypothetical protein
VAGDCEYLHFERSHGLNTMIARRGERGDVEKRSVETAESWTGDAFPELGLPSFSIWFEKGGGLVSRCYDRPAVSHLG